MLLAHGVYDRFPLALFQPSRAEIIAVGALFTLYFFAVTVPAAPLALLILPALLLLLYFSLRRNRRSEPPGSLLTALEGRIGWQGYLALLAMPSVASAVYAVAYSLDIIVPSNWLLYLITTPLGFILLGLSVVNIWRGPSTAAPRR